MNPSLVQIAQLLRDAPVASERWEGGGSGGVLVVLLIILVGCAAAAWFVIKRTGLPSQKGGGHLDVLETRPLGGRQFLVVARHGDEKFLLGVCPGRIDYLTGLKDAAPSAEEASFESALKGAERDPKEGSR